MKRKIIPIVIEGSTCIKKFFSQVQGCMSPATLQKKQNSVSVESNVLHFSENDALYVTCLEYPECLWFEVPRLATEAQKGNQ